MRVDGVAAASRDFGHDRLKAAVRHLDRLAAAPADDVVVMLFGLARHVRVVAVGQIEAFKRAEIGEEVQVAEERGPAQAESPATRIGPESFPMSGMLTSSALSAVRCGEPIG